MGREWREGLFASDFWRERALGIRGIGGRCFNLQSASGVELPMNVLKAGGFHVGVNFRGCDAGVSEHFLDCSQVGAVFQKVRGEAVAQHVRSDVLLDARLFGALFDSQPKGYRRKGAASLVEEHVGRRFWSD